MIVLLLLLAQNYIASWYQIFSFTYQWFIYTLYYAKQYPLHFQFSPIVLEFVESEVLCMNFLRDYPNILLTFAEHLVLERPALELTDWT
jgi:hypothetical protein